MANDENNVQFGTCPFCGKPLTWDSDECWAEDESVTIMYLHCPQCGASIEAMQCPMEDRKDFPDYWKNERLGRK